MQMTPDDATGFVDRVQGRLDRLDLSPDDLARIAGIPPGAIRNMLDGDLPPPRGKRLIKLAEALATSVSYLIGLDPDTPVPEEYLQEDQGSLGLLAGDEEALLRAYRRLDMSSRAALLLIVLKMTPEPETYEKKARQTQAR
jgi:transcriptional regulator with XRE-family HTH domain